MTRACTAIGLVIVACVTVIIETAQAGNVTLEGEIAAGESAGMAPGNVSVSRIAFDVTAGTTVVFDTLAWEDGIDLNDDGKITAFDSQLTLLDGTGRRIAVNDDYSGWLDQNESVGGFDSLISMQFDRSGTYVIALGQVLHGVDEAYKGYETDATLWEFAGQEVDWAAWTLDIRWQDGDLFNIRSLAAGEFPGVGGEVPEPPAFAVLASIVLAIALTAWVGRMESFDRGRRPIAN